MSEEIKSEEIVEETSTKTVIESSDDKVVENIKESSSDDSSDEKKTEGPAPRSEGRHQRGDSGHGQRMPRFRKKVCRFCYDKDAEIDYKDADVLIRFVTDRGKILPRRVTGTCAKHQRSLARAIKRARIIALLPFLEQ